MNIEELIQSLVALGFRDDSTFALRNAVRAAVDAGVPPQSIVSVGSATRGNLSAFSSGVRELVSGQQAEGFPSAVSVNTRETAAGVPAGAFGSPTAPAPAEAEGDIAIPQVVIDYAALTGVPIADAMAEYSDPYTRANVVDTVLKYGSRAGSGGGGAAARTPTYGFTTIGGRVYRSNDLAGTLEDTGISAPGFSNVSTDAKGNLVGIDATGKYQVIQPGFDYATIDPAQTFNEGVRQFDVSEGGLNQRAALNERGAMERAALTEQGARDRAALNAQVQGFQSINTLAPQLGTLALNNANFTRDVLKEGGDYLARAYFQRGGQSPLPTISQADIINQLRENIGGFQGALSTYQGMGGFAPTTTAPKIPVTETFVDPGRAAVPAPVKAPQPTAQEALAARSTPGFAQRVEEMRTRVAGAKGGIPGFAEGGHTTEPMMKVGEKGDEIIINPTNAPIAIIPHEDVSDRMRKGTPGFQDGTGLYDFSRFTAPALPTPAQANQSDLVSLARDTAPPAVTSLAMGNRPDATRFGFALPSPEMLGDLTNFEKDAYKTYLNVVEQTSLEDVEKQVNRQFGRPQGRMGFRTDIK